MGSAVRSCDEGCGEREVAEIALQNKLLLPDNRMQTIPDHGYGKAPIDDSSTDWDEWHGDGCGHPEGPSRGTTGRGDRTPVSYSAIAR